MTEHDDLRDWDGAYLLGALSADARRTFERHLATCDVCSASVAELAALPGLLAKVPAAEAEAVLEQDTHLTPDLLPRLVEHVDRRRRRTRRWVLAAAIGSVAAALMAGALVVPGLMGEQRDPPAVAVELTPVEESPVTASIRLVEEQWGTRIEMECQYDSVDSYSAQTDYAMYVIDADGNDIRVASWTAVPGRTATPSGTTSVAVAQLRSVELRSAGDGTVLLRGTW